MIKIIKECWRINRFKINSMLIFIPLMFFIHCGKSDNNKQKISQKSVSDNQQESTVGKLITSIDSTQHPGITSTVKVLDRSLMVLQIALNDHNVDGLTPSEIAKILTEKFRISTTLYAVGMVLSNATNLVNRVPRGQGYAYKIMAPGEEHLTHLGNEQEIAFIKRYTASGGWETTSWFQGLPAGDLYVTGKGEGYLIYMMQGKMDWRPY